MKTKAVVLLIGMGFLCAVSLTAQASDHPKIYGGFGYFMPGYQFLSLTEMNNSFKAAGFPEISNGALSIGGGGFYVVRNLLIGGEGYGLIGGSVENIDYRVDHAGGCGFFNVGYILAGSPSFLFAPVMGIGGGGISVNIKDRDYYPDNFDDLMEDPARESIISNGGLLLNFSVLTNILIAGYRAENEAGGFYLGLKAGYILNASGNTWYINDEELQGSPAAGMSGPYVSLMIGGGGMGR